MNFEDYAHLDAQSQHLIVVFNNEGKYSLADEVDKIKYQMLMNYEHEDLYSFIRELNPYVKKAKKLAPNHMGGFENFGNLPM